MIKNQKHIRDNTHHSHQGITEVLWVRCLKKLVIVDDAWRDSKPYPDQIILLRYNFSLEQWENNCGNNEKPSLWFLDNALPTVQYHLSMMLNGRWWAFGMD